MKFSIIVPSYNQGKFIKQTIDSILAQDVEKEVFVIDGCSTDGTLDILRSYGDKIKWISEKDKGQTDAINKGLRMVSGDIIAYINSDDYYLSGSLKIVEDLFKKHPDFMWLTGDGIIVDKDGKEIQGFVSVYKKILRSFHGFIYITNFIIQPSTFFRKSVLDEIGFFDETKRYTMDYDYWLRLYSKGYKPLITDYKISAFRIHGLSKGGVKYKEQFVEDFEIVKRYCKNIFLLFLHYLHNKLIVLVYFFIKKI
ncbi:MAG: glycosyltransferase family 2 protein [Brevinematia bacterium]